MLEQLWIRHEPTDMTITLRSNEQGGLNSSSCSATPMHGEKDGTWFLNRVFVPEKYRRKGIGTVLITALKYALRERGCRILTVTPGGYDVPREDQIAFYEAVGFHLVGEPNELGADWWMEWRPTACVTTT